jgi:hypothetical protein
MIEKDRWVDSAAHEGVCLESARRPPDVVVDRAGGARLDAVAG